MVGDGTDDDTANCPKHLQHLGSRGSQFYRHDLTTVCRRVGNEDSPWDALEKLGHKHDWKRFGKVKREDEDVQEHEASQGSVTVSDTASEGTSEEDTDKRTELPRHLKRRLPLGLDDPLAVMQYTEIFLELREGDEVADEEDIVGLHNLKVELAAIPRRRKG